MSIDLKELVSLCKDVKILYVEDDLSARESTLQLLESFFQNITTAVNGEDGFQKFENSNFDLILSDINMPILNGLDMLKLIREENQTIPIVFLSAHNDSKYFLEAISLDIDGFIPKPLVDEFLYKTLYKVLQKIKLLTMENNYKDDLEREVQKRNEEISHKLHFDPLTNLLSRYSFFRDMKQLDVPIILLVDIDKFKILNEVYGTNIGSKVLEKFALYLSLAVNEDNCKVYRISADEFAILDATSGIDPSKYELMLVNLFEELSNKKVKVDEHVITINITIGLSSVAHNGYESAKIALDYAKKHNKPYVMYSNAIDKRRESSLTLKCRDKISSAIDDNRVVSVYQGIIDKNENIVKYETLMRLRRAESKELMSPYEFLDVAIKTRLYDSLSSTVIFTALEKVKNSDITLSVNFIYADIKNTNLMERLHSYFKSNPEIGTRVVFEITESQAIENYDDVKKFIKNFRKYGVSIAIDDFGSGFSNFEYILEIEPDYLKIDGSLVKDIDTDHKAYTLVQAIVEFSHKLGIKVIAEYVHSRIIFEMLKELEVDEYQGFYFYKPSQDIQSVQA